MSRELPDVEAALQALGSEDRDERFMALEVLLEHAEHGRAEDRERLRAAFARMAADDDPAVRLAAAEGLGLCGDPAAAAGAARSVLEAGDEHLALLAARALAQLRDPAGADRLLAALAHRHLRFDALEALRLVGDPRAVEPARRIFKSWLSDRWAMAQAAALLASQGDRAGADYLRKRAGRRWAGERGLVLELIGEVRAEGAYELLTAVAEDLRDRNRTAAVAGLGFLGDRRAEDLLRRLAESDPDEDVKDEAREALEVLHDGAGPGR